jgi:hypothetical protein
MGADCSARDGGLRRQSPLPNIRPDRFGDEFTAAASPNCIAGKACFL